MIIACARRDLMPPVVLRRLPLGGRLRSLPAWRIQTPEDEGASDVHEKRGHGFTRGPASTPGGICEPRPSEGHTGFFGRLGRSLVRWLQTAGGPQSPGVEGEGKDRFRCPPTSTPYGTTLELHSQASRTISALRQPSRPSESPWQSRHKYRFGLRAPEPAHELGFHRWNTETPRPVTRGAYPLSPCLCRLTSVTWTRS